MGRKFRDLMTETLLMRYLRLVVEDAKAERLLKTDDGKEDDGDKVDEFSCVGAIQGYTLPLGANPDDYGRKKNVAGSKSRSRKKGK